MKTPSTHKGTKRHKEETKRYDSSISKVLSIKPGITGLWQVSGRNNLR